MVHLNSGCYSCANRMQESTIYCRVLRKRSLTEGNQPVTNCNGLKMQALDGKMRITDVADVEQVFRLIQSIPSPKAEPFKLWHAEVARGDWMKLKILNLISIGC